MFKRLGLLAVVVAALALAAPAFASAAPTVQTSSGGSVAVPAAVTLTGNDITLTSATLGEITCEKLNFSATLTTNNDTNGWAMSNSGVKPSQTNCKNGTNSVTWTSLTLTSLKSTVGGSVTMSFTAVVDVNTTPCTITGTNVPGTYSNGGNTIFFSIATGITVSPPACGAMKLDGSFVLEAATGGLKFSF
jgi:hypothetical protein